MQRLTAKRDTVLTSDLTRIKLSITSSLYDGVLDPPVCVCIALVLAGDSDQEVARQATFKKSGMRTFLHSSHQNDIADILIFLLEICMIGFQSASCGQLDNKFEYYLLNRTSIRDDHRIGILNWIIKEMAGHLAEIENEAITFLYSFLIDATIFSTSKAMKAAVVLLLDTLSSRVIAFRSHAQSEEETTRKVIAAPSSDVPNTILESSGSSLTSTSETKLTKFLAMASHVLQNYANVKDQFSDEDIRIRESCYNVIDLVCRADPKLGHNMTIHTCNISRVLAGTNTEQILLRNLNLLLMPSTHCLIQW